MRMLERVAVVIAADADGIAVAQQTAGAGALTLNGAGVSGGVATLSPPRRVRLHSAGNIAGVTFTITGTDRGGSAITDTVTGINNSTVATNKVFASVTGITVDGAVGSDVEVGWNGESVTGWIILGNMKGNFSWRLRVFFPAGGTVNYDIEGTSQNILRDQLAGDNPDDLQTLESAQTGNYTSENDVPIAAIRLKVNSSDQPVTMRVQPSRTV